MAIQTFKLILESTEMVTPNIKHLAFVAKDNVPFDYVPGQFITVRFDGGERELKRSYSIASIHGESQLIEIAASYVKDGPGTDLLFHLETGAQITASGPHGRLTLREEKPKRYVLVATSTGVTPYRSMLTELATRIENDDLEVVVLLGVQRREELLYSQDFVDFADQHPNFTFRAHYSREFPEDNQPYEYQGYVQNAFADINIDKDNDVVYLCGNPNMIDDAFEQLKEFGFESQQVRREKYISAK